jgi:hypothetical protein
MSLRVPETLEPYRVNTGPFGTDSGENYGFFTVASVAGQRRPLDLIVSDGIDPISEGWEHVSVKVRIGRNSYTPTWDEMAWVKQQLWEPEDMVIQLHPPASQYINFHPNVLHLWRHRDLASHIKIPAVLVAPK